MSCKIAYAFAVLVTIGLASTFCNVCGQASLIGVKINVPDMREAKKFYKDTLRFDIAKESVDGNTVWLKTSGYSVVLEQSKVARRIKTPGFSHVSMSMRVNDIDETFKKLRAAGVRFIKDEKRKEGIGWSLQILDPFGNKISMMQITVGNPEIIAEPAVYNCGLYVTDIERALSTYKDILGFTVRSRAYMPEDMPLGAADGKFAFMLHSRRDDFAFIESRNMFLMFSIRSHEELDELRRKGSTVKNTHSKDVLLIKDATGVISELHVGKTK